MMLHRFTSYATRRQPLPPRHACRLKVPITDDSRRTRFMPPDCYAIDIYLPIRHLLRQIAFADTPLSAAITPHDVTPLRATCRHTRYAGPQRAAARRRERAAMIC